MVGRARAKQFTDGVPVGRRISVDAPSALGFLRASSTPSTEGELLFSKAGHNLVVAPTGAGKGIGVSIPALLSHRGPVIVIDPKGENYAVTAAHRRRRGDRVVLLDPFGITGEPSDSLNPLDLATVGADAPEDAARVLSDLLTGGAVTLDDPFWDTTATGLLSGLLTTAIVDAPPENRRLSWLRELFAGDLAHSLAVMLDTKQIKNHDAYQEIALFLNIPGERTRPGVEATAGQHLRLFGSAAVRRAIDSSSFPLELVRSGAPLALYIVIPPDKLSSHRSLLRLWLGTLIRVITSRRRIPSRETLLLVDEAAQLGRLNELLQAVTLLRGYGLRLWTFWQDLSQLRGLYPLEWPTLVNNCSTVQLFGARNMRMAEEYASIAGGIDAPTILGLGADRQVLMLDGTSQIAARLDYRTDPAFTRLFAPNPFYDGAGTSPR